MYKVAVLMSTYNGEKYIDEQIKSILEQKSCNIHIYIRDDGSIDNTVNRVNKYDDERIRLIKGENNGASKSFCKLMSLVPQKYEYYAFSDQDDVWDEDKIEIAARELEQFDEDKPCLYFSALNHVDDNLKYIKTKIIDAPVSFEFSLTRSVFPGCTMVLNRSGMMLIQKYNPQHQIMHDLLTYQVISGSGGKVTYDRNSHINYRIHGNNVSDFTSKRKRTHKLISDFNRNRNSRLNALIELQEGYSSVLTSENRGILNKYVNYRNLNGFRRIILGITIPDKAKYKLLCSISMLLKKF